MSIIERNTKNIDNTYWLPEEDTFPVKNRYTVGIAGQKFLEEIKNNAKIVGTKCTQCNITYVPARMYCERCFAELEKYIDVGTEGEIFTYTVAYVDKEGNKKDKPEILAVIKIGDGFIIHLLNKCKQDDIKIGMKVKAVFKPKKERVGSILDIEYFKPI